jgi:hypothetical protein
MRCTSWSLLLLCFGMRIWVRDWLEIRGELMEVLQKAKPALGAGLVSNESSLEFGCGRAQPPLPT